MLEKEQLSKNLKAALEKQNISQAQLAEKVGTTAANISNYMRGNAFPPVDTLVEIAKALEVSLDQLCNMDESEASHSVPQSLGDVARLIDEMYFWDNIKIQFVNETEVYQIAGHYDEAEFGERMVSYPAIIFRDGELKKYICDNNKMKSLLSEKTIDYNFYKRWREDRFSSLDRVPVESLCPFAMLDDDEDLPF